MRKLTWLGTLMLVALVASMPLASSQANQSPTQTSVEMEPFAGPLEDGNVLVTKVVVTYTYMAPAVAMVPTEVALEVEDAPAWLTAALSPSTLTMDVQWVPHGGAFTAHATGVAHLAVAANGTIPEDATDTIRVGAYARPNSHLAGSQGEADIMVIGKASSTICDGTKNTADPAAEEDGLSTQTLGATAAPSLLPVAAAGVIGAAVGLTIARLKSRRRS